MTNIIDIKSRGVKKSDEYPIVINVFSWLSYIVDCKKKTIERLFYETSQGGPRPVPDDLIQIAAHHMHMQLEMAQMIERYEPWRKWDNYRCTMPYEIDFTKEENQFLIPKEWDLFATTVHKLMLAIRQYLLEYSERYMVGVFRLWSLEREDDFTITYSCRLHKHGSDKYETLTTLRFSYQVHEISKDIRIIVEILDKDLQPVDHPLLLLDKNEVSSERVEHFAQLFMKTHPGFAMDYIDIMLGLGECEEWTDGKTI